MVYNILKFLFRITIHSYFKRVRIIGKEKIPENVPCIFIANHPNAFMDPVVVATQVKTPIYFIAAAEFVSGGIKGWICKKFLHTIPVYRPHTRPNDLHKNKDMFAACFNHLSQKGSLIIFPEGRSVTERKLQPFKTGVGRIARGAELKNNLQLNLYIVPFGLNYSDPHAFRSDLFVCVGDPIRVKDYITNVANKETEIVEVDKLTELCEKTLRQAVIDIKDQNDVSLIDKLNTIYSSDLKLELEIEYGDQEREFNIQKGMIEAIEYFKFRNPDRFNTVTNDIDIYTQKLAENGLNDQDIVEMKFKKSFRKIIWFVLGFPFFIFGFLNNFIPYFFLNYLIPKIKVNENFLGSLMFGIGMVTFLIFYSAAAICLGLLTPLSWWALLYPFAMYASGIFALVFYSAVDFAIKRKKLRRLLKSNNEMMEDLIVSRKKLINTLSECRVEFELRNSNMN